ncbi:MAG: TonB-dependent receptor, partial [Caulobacterales bacterium]
PVKQEQLTSYEVGAKFAAFDRTLRVNSSVFFYDYKDKQVYTYFPLPAPLAGVSSFISNVPKSEIRGFDVDASWTPTRHFTLRGAVTYLDSEAKAFAAFDGNGVIVEANGKDLPFAPKWSGNVDAEYRMDLNDALEAYVGGSVNYTDSSFQDLAEQPKGFLPSYTTIDLRLGVNATAGWNIGIFGRNITDKDYWTSSFKAGDEYSRYMGTPRTYGVVAGYRF